MNKYSDKSNEEISRAVVIALGAKEIWPDVYNDDTRRYEFDPKTAAFFDPCNNPADAMPIIVDHRISLILPGVKYGDSYSAGYAASGLDETVDGEIITKFTSFNENIFRAAMEVFLMVKDAEK